MNIADWITSLNVVDILIFLFLFGMFILGYIQGSIRRVLGILSITFSFFLAMLLNDAWLGEFLAQNWTQFPREYSIMLGYLVIFVAGVGATTLVLQGTYRKAEVFAKYPVIDEVLGGLLGVLQGFLFLLFITIILDQYFLYANLPKDENELGILRDVWTAIDGSAFGRMLHETVIPVFLNLTSFLIPSEVRALYGLS